MGSLRGGLVRCEEMIIRKRAVVIEVWGRPVHLLVDWYMTTVLANRRKVIAGTSRRTFELSAGV